MKTCKHCSLPETVGSHQNEDPQGVCAFEGGELARHAYYRSISGDIRTVEWKWVCGVERKAWNDVYLTIAAHVLPDGEGKI